MPVYEYECADCKNRFEVRQRFVEEPVSVCPSCGGKVRRVYHPVGIVFKGSGFYVTDNRSSGEPTSATTTSEAKSGEAKPAETKASETKPSESKPTTPSASASTESKGSSSGGSAGPAPAS